jgi:hypothetical protein
MGLQQPAGGPGGEDGRHVNKELSWESRYPQMFRGLTGLLNLTFGYPGTFL